MRWGSWSRVLSGAAMVVGLSACATLPESDEAPYKRPLPASWAGADAGSGVAAPLDTWWRVFDDPMLDAAVVAAAGENDAVWRARAQAAQARAQAVIAGADRLPAVGAGGSAQATRRNNGFGLSTTDSYGISLNVSWEVDLWGRLAAQSEAAREGYLASTEALRAVRQSVAAQTAKAYFATVESRQQVDLSRRTLDVLTETARQVGNRADVGVGSPGDKYLALSNRDAAAAGLAGNEEVLDRVSRQLQLLLSDYPDGVVDTAQALATVPPLPSIGIPAAVLARRPDIRAAERQLRATGFQVFSAERTLLPAISLSGSVGTASTELGQLLDGDFSTWTLAGNLLQPIFQGGRLRANVELNEARRQEAASAYAQTVLNALVEVESALAARDDIARREQTLCSAADSARQAETISFNRYSQGVEPFLTVLQSQQRALDISGSCIAARRAGLDNHIDLLLALGGGFEETPAEPESVGTRLRKRFGGSEPPSAEGGA